MTSWLDKIISKHNRGQRIDRAFWDNCKEGVDYIYKHESGFQFFLKGPDYPNEYPVTYMVALEKVVRDKDFWINLLSNASDSTDRDAAKHLIEVYNRAIVLFDIWEHTPVWMRQSLLLNPIKYGDFMKGKYSTPEDNLNEQHNAAARSLSSKRVRERQGKFHTGPSQERSSTSG